MIVYLQKNIDINNFYIPEHHGHLHLFFPASFELLLLFFKPWSRNELQAAFYFLILRMKHNLERWEILQYLY